jgi:hypothetical protein
MYLPPCFLMKEGTLSMYALNELKSWIFRSSTRYAFMADPRSVQNSREHSAAMAARK